MNVADAQEARDFLAAHPEVRSIELMLIDANGVPRGKLLHRDELLAIYEEGRPLPSSILALTLQGEDVEATGLVWEVADVDCWTYPLPGSLTLQPWRSTPTGQVQVSMHPTQGLPATPADPRHAMVRVIERLQADGFQPVMAVELEFYLLDRTRDAQGRPQPALQMNGVRPGSPQVYGVYELEQLQPFLDDLYAACEVQGLPVRTAISEYAPGQLELTLLHRFDALQAIDEGIRYKRLVKGVANRHGLQACFRPSRSATRRAAACTCTSAWPMPKATTSMPATTRRARRCCAIPSAACSTGCWMPWRSSVPTPTPTAVSRPTAMRRWPRAGGSTTAAYPCACRVVRPQSPHRTPHLRRRCQSLSGRRGHPRRHSRRHP